MEAHTSVEKAIDVLFHLHQQGGSLGVTEIGRSLGLPKSSAHRLLAALGRRDLVERDDHGRYRTGFALMALGLGVLEREPLAVAAGSVLEGLAAAVGETVFLVHLRAGRIVVLDKAEGSGFLRAAPQVGSEVPVHATAVGKLFLTHARDELAPRGSTRTRYTPRTMTSSPALDRAVADARRRGWAANRDEWIVGLSVIASPVFLGSRMVAALALAAPSPRFKQLGAEALGRQIRRAADRVTARLAGPVRRGDSRAPRRES